MPKNDMTRYYCTLFDINYLTRGLALHNSLVANVGDFHLWILCMDEETYELLNKLNLSDVTLIKLSDFEGKGLLKVKPNRTHGEYCWTCTSSLPLYIFKHFSKVKLLSYLDSDLYFYSSPEPIFKEFGNNSIMIIPHRFSVNGKEKEKKAGIYNVSMVTFRRDTNGLKCLNWWRKKCLEWCFNRQEDGKLGDQKYLDYFPELFKKVHILKNIGANVAPWNIAQYKVSRKKEKIFLNDSPLIFYHFLGLKIYRPLFFLPSVSPLGYGEWSSYREVIYNQYYNKIYIIFKLVRKFSSDFDKGFILRPKFSISMFETISGISLFLRHKVNVPILLIIILLFLSILTINSYGTGDVRLWVSWAKSFTDSGFWPNFVQLSDIPLLTTLWVYLSGLITKTIFGVVTPETFPIVMKLMLLPFLYLCLLFVSLFIKTENKKVLEIPIIFMILVNPAIIMNLVILGYMDILFIVNLLLCVYLLFRVETGKNFHNLEPLVFSVALVVGLFIKAQWIMFFPILFIFGGILFYRKKVLKLFSTGLFVGWIILLSVIIYGVGNISEVPMRLIWIKVVWEKIANQPFVVANFPNFWHLLNYFFHICQPECAAADFIRGACYQNCANIDVAMSLFRPMPYWVSKPLAIAGKSVFIIASIVYSTIIFKHILKKHLFEIKNWSVGMCVSLLLWMNIIYVFFNTTVHENHFIASVFLSIVLYVLSPTLKNFTLFIFFTAFNFLNLFYYYGLGISGLFGLFPLGNSKILSERLYFSPYGLNISLLLAICFIVYLCLATYRLIKGRGTNLGLT